MALTRFNGNVVPFASESTTDNRTVFGDVVQADDIDSNLNADFKKGWEIVGLNDNPTKQDFNAMGYTLGALTSYLYQMGIAEYNASQEYKLNAVCIGTDGTIYQSLVDANIGNALNNGTKWKNVTGSYVTLTGDQDIDDIKTFLKSPIVPTPTTGTQAANKNYVDNVAVTPDASTTVKGIVELATDAEAQAGTDNIRAITPAGLMSAFNKTGTAPMFACRAWVNFNGTETVAIRASGNISSITDNGVGNYTVNFTTAMPDGFYAPQVTGQRDTDNGACFANIHYPQTPTTTSCRIHFKADDAGGVDVPIASFAVFR